MRYIDRAFAIACLAFFCGVVVGLLSVVFSVTVLGLALGLLQARMIAPIRAVSGLGTVVVFLLVFLNNSIPAALSFLYPLAIEKIHWVPPMTTKRKQLLLTLYTLIVSFLIGLFGVGAVLGAVWVSGGSILLKEVVSAAWLHGPLELSLVLVCVAEPLRAAYEGVNLLIVLRKDLKLLKVCIPMLLISAAIEVFMRL